VGVHLQPKESLISNIILLRSVIGYLGEKDHFKWWDSLFLSATGLEFLKINFPRTVVSSGINSVSEAAKRVHDKFIGVGGVYHLFRMSSSIEEDIHTQLLHKNTPDLVEITQAIQNRDTALSRLHSMAGDDGKSVEGPVHIGKIKDLLNGSLIGEIAWHYMDAFAKDKKVYPYFSE